MANIRVNEPALLGPGGGALGAEGSIDNMRVKEPAGVLSPLVVGEAEAGGVVQETEGTAADGWG
jgi:hypothetical protein